jgi:prepilin-type N-terminal cleavage/methylation domain-containing protein
MDRSQQRPNGRGAGFSRHPSRLATLASRYGFTLIELMVVITIIGLLFTTLMGARYSAQNMAKRARTQQIVSKMHNQLMPKWEGYQTRRLPIGQPTASTPADLAGRINASQTALVAAGQRLGAVRELMRIELPDTYTDVQLATSNNQQYLLLPNGQQFVPRSVYLYQNNVANAPTRLTPPQPAGNFSNQLTTVSITNSSSECLYMIVTLNTEDRDSTALAVSAPETSDTDLDGMKEFSDGWGNPFLFCRWAGAFVSELQPMYSVPPSDPRYGSGQAVDPDPRRSTNHLTRDPVMNHDPLDVLGIDRWEPQSQGPWSNQPEYGFALFPLIMSGGDDFDPTQSASGNDGFGVRFTASNTGISKSAPFSIQNAACPYYQAGTSNQNGTILDSSAYNNVHNQSSQSMR